MFKKKLVNKCLAFGLSFSIVFGGMSGMTVRGNGAADTEAVSMAGNAMDEVSADGSEMLGVPEDAEDVADADVLNEQVGDAVEDGTLEVNEKPVVEFADVVYVEGSWVPSKHETLATGTSVVGTLAGNALAIVKLGAVAPDRKFGGMKVHSVNVKCVNGYNCPRGYYCVTLMQDEINQRFYDGGMTTEDDRGKLTGEVTWADLLENKYTVNNENKSLFIYGLALHILTDTFSHSSFEPNSKAAGGWKRITHDGGADKIDFIPQRYSCATYISNLLIEHIIKKETGSVADFFNLITSPVFTREF